MKADLSYLPVCYALPIITVLRNRLPFAKLSFSTQCTCLWTTHKSCKCSLSTSSAVTGFWACTQLPPEKCALARAGVSGRGRAQWVKGQSEAARRLIYVLTHACLRSRFISTRSLERKAKSCHSGRQQEPGCVHTLESLQQLRLKLRCLGSSFLLSPRLSLLPGVALVQLSPPTAYPAPEQP